MKRIPRSFPITRSNRPSDGTRAADGTIESADALASAADECSSRLSPQDQALLERLRRERDLRLQRGLRSEASGIQLAMRVICEAALRRDEASRERTR